MTILLRITIIAAALMLTPGASACAQSEAQRLLGIARAQLDNLEGDSAYKYAALALRAGPTPLEKKRGYILLGIGELMKGNASKGAARDAFVEALKLDPRERVDSLKDYASDILIVFAEAVPRAAAELAAIVLTVNVTLSPDTMVSAADARYVFSVEPNLRSTVVSRIVRADAPNVTIWSDSQPTQGKRIVSWPLLGADSAMIADGGYVFRAQAFDSTGRITSIHERTFRLTRAMPDTQVAPPPLAPSTFAPETLAVAKGRPPRLLFGGVSIAALVAVVPARLGNATLNDGLSSDPTVYAVAGGVAVASIVGFIRARTPAKLSAENIEKNRVLRDNDRRLREGIAQNNARARAQAAMRVTVVNP